MVPTALCLSIILLFPAGNFHILTTKPNFSSKSSIIVKVCETNHCMFHWMVLMYSHPSVFLCMLCWSWLYVIVLFFLTTANFLRRAAEKETERYLMISDIDQDPWTFLEWTTLDTINDQRLAKKVRIVELFRSYYYRFAIFLDKLWEICYKISLKSFFKKIW